MGAGEAVLEGQAQLVGVAEAEGSADAVDGGVGVEGVLQIEEIEEVALADPEDLGAPVDGPIGGGDRDGDVSVERLAVGRLHAARADVKLDGRPRSVPVHPALPRDAASADAHLELPERYQVLLDLEIPDERRDREKGRLDARDREKAAPREERVLVGEAKHRVGAPLLAPLQRDAVGADFDGHGDGHLAVRGFDDDSGPGERDVHVVALDRGPDVVVEKVGRRDGGLRRDLSSP